MRKTIPRPPRVTSRSTRETRRKARTYIAEHWTEERIMAAHRAVSQAAWDMFHAARDEARLRFLNCRGARTDADLADALLYFRLILKSGRAERSREMK